jgi:hypothetical protein
MRLRRLRPFAGPRIGPVPSYPHRKLQSAVMGPPGFRSPIVGPPRFFGRVRFLARRISPNNRAATAFERQRAVAEVALAEPDQGPRQPPGSPVRRAGVQQIEGAESFRGRKPGIRMPLGPADAGCRTAENVFFRPIVSKKSKMRRGKSLASLLLQKPILF